MEEMIIKKAMRLYITKLEDVSFAETQIDTRTLKTVKQIAKDISDFKNECNKILSKDIKYPDSYSDLEIRMIYFGLIDLREVLAKEYEGYINIYADDSNNYNAGDKLKILRSMDCLMDERTKCNLLQFEFLNLFFDNKKDNK